jgi:CheY-like chemotaxis protein
VTPFRILYVEDHADTAEVFAALFRRWGHTVTVANSISEARSFLSDCRYDLLLCDLNLPGGSGNALIRELGDTLPMNAIAVSGFASTEEIDEANEAGFQGYLTKPVRVADLKAMFESLATKNSHS